MHLPFIDFDYSYLLLGCNMSVGWCLSVWMFSPQYIFRNTSMTRPSVTRILHSTLLCLFRSFALYQFTFKNKHKRVNKLFLWLLGAQYWCFPVVHSVFYMNVHCGLHGQQQLKQDRHTHTHMQIDTCQKEKQRQ